MEKICVLGDGGWGTTVSMLLQEKGHQVSLWSHDKEYAKILHSKRENEKFFPGFQLPLDIEVTSDLKEALLGKDFIIIAVPSIYIKSVIKEIDGFDRNCVFISLTKGIEQNGFKRASELITEELSVLNLAVLSGPAIAYEVANKIPSSVVAASEHEGIAQAVQDLFLSSYFRVYTSKDVIGVELGGALKNIIAIAAGVCDGLGFGANTKAALLSRGLAEMARFGKIMGACAETLFGLSGLGDMITTSFSPKSRNRTLGEEIGRGKKIDSILKSKNTIAEGFYTAKAVYEFSKNNNIDMPITEQVYQVLYCNKPPYQAVCDLMSREAKPEKL
ncbi:MAG: NAD(P)-dependent glycerol-3-phosphate dehydrogenase [Candidatus Omnitrophica bacterium]|nr:NAD(P)-dependent glycerol-3-phosphate dehydrogenase [Candidatus Omnitrophota bacterium]